MATDVQLKVRDTRNANWFWMENVVLDVFQPILGAFGLAVYSALCSEVGRSRRVRVQLGAQETDMTVRDLGALAGVSKDTAARMLSKMVVLGMIVERRREGRGRQARTVYELCNLQLAAKPGSAALKAKLAAAGLERAASVKPSVQEDARGMLLFDDGEGALAEADPVAAGYNPSDPDVCVSEGDKESDNEAKLLSPPAAICVSPSGDIAAPSDDVSILEEDKTQDRETHPNPPASGRAFEIFSDVLHRVRQLRPGRGDEWDLREQVAALLESMGFSVMRKAQIANRGDGAKGFLDLLAVRVPPGLPAADERAMRIAIQIDSGVARDRSLMKLRAVDGAFRLVLLRTAVADGSFPGINAVVAMGWPGNGTAELRSTKDAAKRVGLAELVGQPTPWGRAAFRQAMAVARASIEETYADVDKAGWDAALAEWDKAFDGIEYLFRVLLPSGRLSLTVGSHDPPATGRGIALYEERLQREMVDHLGCRVEFVVLPMEGAMDDGDD